MSRTASSDSGYLRYRVSCYDTNWTLLATDSLEARIDWVVAHRSPHWDNTLPTREFRAFIPLGGFAEINANFSLFVCIDITLSLVVNI